MLVHYIALQSWVSLLDPVGDHGEVSGRLQASVHEQEDLEDGPHPHTNNILCCIQHSEVGFRKVLIY